MMRTGTPRAVSARSTLRAAGKLFCPPLPPPSASNAAESAATGLDAATNHGGSACARTKRSIPASQSLTRLGRRYPSTSACVTAALRRYAVRRPLRQNLAVRTSLRTASRSTGRASASAHAVSTARAKRTATAALPASERAPALHVPPVPVLRIAGLIRTSASTFPMCCPAAVTACNPPRLCPMRTRRTSRSAPKWSRASAARSSHASSAFSRTEYGATADGRSVSPNPTMSWKTQSTSWPSRERTSARRCGTSPCSYEYVFAPNPCKSPITTAGASSSFCSFSPSAALDDPSPPAAFL
mmetsp:Transcript_7474/g.24825  ORF Transcript_7474/g.24825 Transcript_7474/m.24825 type:complete len:299 (-) Transcript_7474:513-1409(-)